MTIDSTPTASHIQDVELIGALLLEEAEERGWCSEFDSFVESLNTKLHVALPTRHQPMSLRCSFTMNAGVGRNSVDELINVLEHVLQSGDFDNYLTGKLEDLAVKSIDTRSASAIVLEEQEASS